MNTHIHLFLLLSIFLLSACSNGSNLLQEVDRVVEQKKSTNLVNTTADLNSLSHSNIPDTTFATILYENLYKDFKDRGLSDVQSRARAKIGIEVYQGEPGHIVFNGSHFYYVDGTDKRYEGQTYANCSIYALIRLLKHLGQCGYIDTDFWKQYSDEELRIMIDNMGARGKGYYISQGVTVVPLTLHTLMQTLIPEVPDQYRQIYKPNGIMLTRDDL